MSLTFNAVLLTLTLAFAAPALAEDEGQAAFAGQCSFCHSVARDTSGVSLTRAASADFESFAATVRSGRSGPRGEMPAIPENALSDAELRAIYAHVRAAQQQQTR